MIHGNKSNADCKNEPRHVMIDIETMDKIESAAIPSIGAITFDPLSGKYGKTFYRELDWRDQDRTQSDDTVAFWAKQPQKARDALKGVTELYDALDDLAEWLPAGCQVWGNGPEFDIAILQHAYRQEMIPIPWAFYRVHSCRTMMLLWQAMTGSTAPINAKTKGTYHNALDDAKNQAKEVTRMYRVMVDSYWGQCRTKGVSNISSVHGPLARSR